MLRITILPIICGVKNIKTTFSIKKHHILALKNTTYSIKKHHIFNQKTAWLSLFGSDKSIKSTLKEKNIGIYIFSALKNTTYLIKIYSIFQEYWNGSILKNS